MERANFKRLDRHEIIEATKAVSDWGLNMDVDFSVFEKFDLYARGDTLGTRYRRRLLNWFRLESVQLAIYKRMVLIVKLKPSKKLLGRARRFKVRVVIVATDRAGHSQNRPGDALARLAFSHARLSPPQARRLAPERPGAHLLQRRQASPECRPARQ